MAIDDITTSEQVAWVLKARVKEGQRANVEELLREAVAATRSHNGALNYEFYLDDDGNLLEFEKYADATSTLEHLAWFGENLAERLMPAIDIESLLVLGDPPADVRGVFDQMGASYSPSFGGFAR